MADFLLLDPLRKPWIFADMTMTILQPFYGWSGVILFSPWSLSFCILNLLTCPYNHHPLLSWHSFLEEYGHFQMFSHQALKSLKRCLIFKTKTKQKHPWKPLSHKLPIYLIFKTWQYYVTQFFWRLSQNVLLSTCMLTEF